MNEEEVAAVEQWQMQTHSFRVRVLAIAESSLGFAGAELNHKRRELLLFGVGEPPPKLIREIETAPPTIQVSWREAPFTLRELTEEALRVMRDNGDRITGGGPLHDGTGIRIATTDPGLLEDPNAQESLGSLYPVLIEYGRPALPA